MTTHTCTSAVNILAPYQPCPGCTELSGKRCRKCGRAYLAHTMVSGVGAVCPLQIQTFEAEPESTLEYGPVAGHFTVPRRP